MCVSLYVLHLRSMRKAKLILLIGCLVYLPFQSMAWGLLGHRIVGQIAEFYLTAKTRKQISEILGDSSIAMSSNWADFIKSDTSFNYLYNWHFTNLADGFTKEDLRGHLDKDTIVDAYTRVFFLKDALKKKGLSKDKKLLYLRMLIHIVGDLHQPMHVGHADDLGGNKTSVLWFNEPSNLHKVWDEQLIQYQELSYTEYASAINHPTKDQVTTWQKQPVTDWMFESYKLSRELYKQITYPDQKLSYRYNYEHAKELNERLLKGGVRLAGVLNEIFDAAIK